MLELDTLFLIGATNDAMSQWRSILKTFQNRLGNHFARTEARFAANDFDVRQILLLRIPLHRQYADLRLGSNL